MSLLTTRDSCVPIEMVSRDITLRDYLKSKTVSSHHKEDLDDPFYIVNIGRLVRLHRLWKSALPKIKPFYAVKCNDDPAVLSTLASLGTGFDCASKGEIKQILDLGVSPERLVFANPCKQTSHLKYAAKKDVSLMTFDNEMELYKTVTHYPKAKLLVRIRADDPAAVCQLGIKFGCSVSEAFQLLHVAAGLCLDVVGVSFHVGSGCQTPDAFRVALEMSRQVFEYGASLGFQFTILDIGGGFPGTDKEIDLFQKVASTINQSIDRLFSDRPDLQIIAEPGRFFAASSFTLAVQVTSKRSCKEDNSFMYYVNDGVYGSFNNILYDHAVVKPQPLQAAKDDAVIHSCTIWGPTCDGLDKICVSSLPELSVGDWLVFEEMGAYTISAHSPFNGFHKPISYYYVREDDRSLLEESCSDVLIGNFSADYPSPAPLAVKVNDSTPTLLSVCS